MWTAKELLQPELETRGPVVTDNRGIQLAWGCHDGNWNQFFGQAPLIMDTGISALGSPTLEPPLFLKLLYQGEKFGRGEQAPRVARSRDYAGLIILWAFHSPEWTHPSKTKE